MGAAILIQCPQCKETLHLTSKACDAVLNNNVSHTFSYILSLCIHCVTWMLFSEKVKLKMTQISVTATIINHVVSPKQHESLYETSALLPGHSPSQSDFGKPESFHIRWGILRVDACWSSKWQVDRKPTFSDVGDLKAHVGNWICSYLCVLYLFSVTLYSPPFHFLFLLSATPFLKTSLIFLP